MMSKYIESYGKQAFAVKQKKPFSALHSFELLKMNYWYGYNNFVKLHQTQ